VVDKDPDSVGVLSEENEDIASVWIHAQAVLNDGGESSGTLAHVDR
jgi:hypothetical protein